MIQGRNRSRDLDRQMQEALPSGGGATSSSDEPKQGYIDPLSLPMDANPARDERVPGELDDMGWYTYKTRSGTIYTTAPKPDQRTTRTKVGDWVDAGAPLPSREQVVEVAKQLPFDIYDTIAGAVRGRGTLGEILEIASGTMGAVGSVAKAPAGALRSGPARTAEPKQKENPLYRERREIPEVEVSRVEIDEDIPADRVPSDPLSDPRRPAEQTPYSFYSPIRQTVENMDFGTSKGASTLPTISGQAIRNELTRVLNQGGGIRNAELVASDIPLDPKKKYTKDEAMQIVAENTWEVKPVYDRSYSTEQRQFIADPVVHAGDFDGYVEITLEAQQPKAGGFRPSEDTHYTNNTVAHARLSQRQGEDGDYLLVEEYQSDLMARGAQAAQQGSKGMPEAEFRPYVEKELDRLLGEMESPFKKMTPEKRELIIDSALKGWSRSLYNRARSQGRTTDSDWNESLDKLKEKMGKKGEDLSFELEDLLRKQSKVTPTIKNAPFKSPEEWLRLTFLSTIAEAQRRGLDRIAIPSAEDLAKYRMTHDPDTNQLVRLTEDQKVGFKNMYGKVLDKVIRQIEGELGEIKQSTKRVEGANVHPNAIEAVTGDLEELSELLGVDFAELVKSSDKEVMEILKKSDLRPAVSEMALSDLQRYHQMRAESEGATLRMLDISNLPDLSKTEMRFAQGGLVNTLDSDAFANYLKGNQYG